MRKKQKSFQSEGGRKEQVNSQSSYLVIQVNGMGKNWGGRKN